MSALLHEEACYYVDDEPEYYPEDPEPANLAWLDRLTANTNTPKPSPSVRLTMLPSTATSQAIDAAPSATLSLVGSPAYQEQQVEEVRRDGTAIVIRSAYDLELALHCFKLEADRQSLIEAEPHFRRVARALGFLTRAAARARKFIHKPHSLFEE